MTRIISTSAGPAVVFDFWRESPRMVPSLHASEVRWLCSRGRWCPEEELRWVFEVKSVFSGAVVVDRIDWARVNRARERYKHRTWSGRGQIHYAVGEDEKE